MTDFPQIHRDGQRGPTSDFLLGRKMEHELLVKLQTAQWKKSAEAIRTPGLAGFRVFATFCGILDFIHQRAWQGACHASSVVFHVLLREQGADSVLCHGMAEKNGILFNHSWVEIEGRVYDAAISNTVSRDVDSPPVFAGIDLATMQDTRLVYGAQSPREADEIVVFAREKGFNAYMDAFPHLRHGLWGAARDVGKRIGVRLNIAKLRAVYADTAWIERAPRERNGEEPDLPGDRFATGADPSLGAG